MGFSTSKTASNDYSILCFSPLRSRPLQKVSRVPRRANRLSAIMLYSFPPPLSLSRRLSEEDVQHKWSKCGVTVIWDQVTISIWALSHLQLFVPFFCAVYWKAGEQRRRQQQKKKSKQMTCNKSDFSPIDMLDCVYVSKALQRIHTWSLSDSIRSPRPLNYKGQGQLACS